MNGVQTRFKCKLDVKRCKRFVFPPSSLLPRSNALKTKAIRYFQTDQTLTRIVSSPLFVKQFPVLTPEQVSTSGYEQDIVERIARLCWFNHDLDGWMEELREECPAEYDLPEEPVIWDEGQRAVWQAELDAIFAHLYGLTTEDLRYILDPEDVCGKGCINETFRVLKEREHRELGEYRTKRLVMEAWNKFGFDR